MIATIFPLDEEHRDGAPGRKGGAAWIYSVRALS
jgi:hypothetical protein